MSQAIAMSAFAVRQPTLTTLFARFSTFLNSLGKTDPQTEAILAFRDMDTRLLEDLGVTAGDVDQWEYTGIVPKSLEGRIV